MNLYKGYNIRKIHKTFYSESEIWDLIKGVINGLHYLKKKMDLPLKNLRFENIYIDDKDHFKITDPDLFQDFKSNYCEFLSIKFKKQDLNKIQNVFLSPIQLEVKN